MPESWNSCLTLHDLPGQLAALGALVIAEPALVRLLPGVASSVHRQVGTVLEHLRGERIQLWIKVSFFGLF